MICSETREYLFAFLDNELDAHLSIEVQRHLDHCPDCAQQAEIEREIHKQLAAKLEDGALVPPLDESALRGVLTSARPATVSSWSSLSRRYVLQSAGVAAAVLAVFIIWRGLRPADVADRPDAGLAQLVVQDYEHFLQEGQKVQLASADAREVSIWLRGKTGLEVSFAEMTGLHCKLLGARKCKIAGQPAAFALYEMEGTPVSLVATDGATIGVGQMKRVENGANEYWVDRCEGHTVVATRAGDLVYAAVSTLPQNDLIHLIESVVYESD